MIWNGVLAYGSYDGVVFGKLPPKYWNYLLSYVYWDIYLLILKKKERKPENKRSWDSEGVFFRVAGTGS